MFFSRDSVMVIHECNVYKTGYLAVSGTSVIKLLEMAQTESFCNEETLQSGLIGLFLDSCSLNCFKIVFDYEKEVVRSQGFES